MPKIKAYKGAGKIIPIDQAKISTAFRCPWTSKVFGAKREYVKHLRDLRTHQIHRRIRDMSKQRKLENLWQQPSFDAIVDWIFINPEFMFDNALENGFFSDRNRLEKHRKDFWLKITYLDLRYNNSVSNTHDCPRDGVTNWGGREFFKDGTPKPRGYPGWHGRIEYQMSHDMGFGSSAMRNLGIHTGTGGGGGGNNYGYDVRFFAADWPVLAEERRNRMVLSVLSDDDNVPDRIKYGEPKYFR